MTNIHEDSAGGVTTMGIRSTGRKGCTSKNCPPQIQYGRV